MKNSKWLRNIIIIAIAVLAVLGIFLVIREKRLKVKVLILPKFEVGDMAGDYPGEAQLYYEGYLKDCREYTLPGDDTDSKLYYKDGIALYVLGMGKTASAMNLVKILEDDRFDFSDAYIISTGCAGGSTGTCVPGDVVIASAVVDYDLGYRADIREMQDREGVTWFHDSAYDENAYKVMDASLIDKIFRATKDLNLSTTDVTTDYMRRAFEDEDWALRNPKTMKGTVVTSDTYWKGLYNHNEAIYICDSYGCKDAYAATEMEDIAVANVADKYNMLNRLVIIRVIVDEDTFMNGATPEKLWDPDFVATIASNDSEESLGIFETAMENNFRVGKEIIDKILK